MSTKQNVESVKKIEDSIKKESREYIKGIENALRGGQYQPMIRDISFWNYKNISNGTKLEFNFPVSLIIGPNGTNKTSILRALESCPDGKSLSDYWFDTKLDPISMSESKKPEYVYSYDVYESRNVKPQVRYRRALKRGREEQDYFETARPTVNYNMQNVDFSNLPEKLGRYHTATRWSPMKKNVHYIDMRQRVSAYDINKSFGIEDHLVSNSKPGSKGGASQKMKNRIRQTSKRMYDIFEAADSGMPEEELNEMVRNLSTWHKKVRAINPPVSLSVEEVEWISYILGRKYNNITIFYHSFFGLPGSTIKVKVGSGGTESEDVGYSEAYAGSGEYAVIMMVHTIYNANKKSLILMDEPENSLHPESQRRMMKYILLFSLAKKIQFIISTHSQYMSESMPDESRIMLYINEEGAVESEASVGHSEAFIGIGGFSEEVFGRTNIQTEDQLASVIVREALYRFIGRRVEKYIFNTFGSCSHAYARHIPTYIKDFREDVLVILDGDQNYCGNTDILERLESKYSDIESDKYILCRVALYYGKGGYEAVSKAIDTDNFDDVYKSVKNLILPDSNTPHDIIMKKARRAYSWLKGHVFYLPGSGNPEMWLLDIMGYGKFTKDKAKEFFRSNPEVREYARVFSEVDVSPQDSFKFQEEKVRALDKAHLEGVYNIVKNFN